MAKQELKLPTADYDWQIDLPEIGDAMHVHLHGEGDNHLTIVARGAIETVGDAQVAGRILKAGEWIDWPVMIYHGFKAIEPNTRVFNIRKALK